MFLRFTLHKPQLCIMNRKLSEVDQKKLSVTERADFG
jgi:hypothetical protein